MFQVPTATLGCTLLIACGPPAASTDGNTTTTTTNTTGTSTETTDTDPSTDTNTDPTDPTDPDTSDFTPKLDNMEDMACNSFLQDCPDGQKCSPYSSTGPNGSWDAHKCVPILGDAATGEPCTWDGIVEATDTCDGTGYCFYVEEQGDEFVGTCLAFCAGDAQDPICPQMSSCSITGDGSLTLCIPTCDPVLQDCNPDQGCWWTGSSFTCAPQTMDLPAGDPCGFINDCDAGLICVDEANFPDCLGASCCTPFCSLSEPGTVCDAVPGTTCVPFFNEDPPLPGYEDVGVCVAM